MKPLIIKLRQHTPLIHFQHDQDGATLRASEVKPKLDKFIIEKTQTDSISSNWFTGKKEEERKSLAYKIRITPVGVQKHKEMIFLKKGEKDGEETLLSDRFPSYFGNLMSLEEFENGKPYKKTSFYDEIEIEIFTYDESLRNKIKEVITGFFWSNNFGTRQSKGFGSFTVSHIDGTKVPLPNPPSGTHYLQIENPIELRGIFEVIDYYWKRLKSGINYSKYKIKDKITKKYKWVCDPAGYQKSFLFEYINTYLSPADQYTWEKRWLKETFFGITVRKNSKTPKYVRGLLGLQDKFEFISKDFCNPDSIEKNEMIKAFEIKSIKPVHRDGEIDRIKSPLIFKPIIDRWHTYIYVIVDDLHLSNEIYGKKSINKLFDFNDQGHQLALPDKKIDFADLLDKYHTHLGSRFEAKNFGWETIANVATGKTN